MLKLPLTSVVLSLSLTVAVASGQEPDDVLATYENGTVTGAEYASWLLYRGLEPDDTGVSRQEVETLALRETLSAAVGNTERQAPKLQFDLQQIEVRHLAAAYRRHAARGVTVSEQEVDAVLASMEENRFWPRRLKMRNLSKIVPSGASPIERTSIRAEIEDLRARLLAGEDFDALARAESDSETRFRGGRMGILSPEDLPRRLATLLFGLSEGEISQVVETSNAFVIFLAEKEFPARTLTVEESKQRIRDYLVRTADREAWEAIQADIRESIELLLPTDGSGFPDGDAVIARSPSGAVHGHELPWLLGSPAGTTPRPGRARIEAALQDHLARVEAAQRARDLGLGSEPRVRASIHWERLARIADVEIVRRLEEAFVEPSEADLRTWIDEHPERYQRQERFLLEALRIPIDDGQVVETAALAERLREQITAGELSIAEAAREHSDLVYPEQPGLLGWLNKTGIASFGPAVLGTVVESEAGALPRPVRQDEALWIVRWTEREAPRPLTYAEAEPFAKVTLGRTRAQELQEQIEDEAREGLSIRLVAD